MAPRPSDRPALNKDLLVATMAHVETHPEEWYQASWHCGTKACFAGHAAMLTGATWINRNSISVRVPAEVAPTLRWGNCSDPECKRCGTHERMSVAEYAGQVLGLSEGEDVLFRGSNTMDDLRAYVKGLLNDEDITTIAWQRTNVPFRM